MSSNDGAPSDNPQAQQPPVQMSNQKYKRTNFDEEEHAAGASRQELPSPASNYEPGVTFQRYKGNIWKSRTLLEKILLLIIIIFFILIIIFIILLAIGAYRNGKNQGEGKLCTNKYCVNRASHILDSLDSSINPCDDFYHYVCGNWIRNHPIPSSEVESSHFGTIASKNKQVIKEQLELPLNESRNQAERKTRILYQSCMDKDGHIEKLGFTPIYPLFKQIGGWSISTVGGVKFENSSDWKLQDLLERLSHHHPFFLLTKSPNPIKSQEHMLKMYQKSFLQRDIAENKTEESARKRKITKNYMVDLAVLLGGSKKEVEELAEEVLEFESKLTLITDTLEKSTEESGSINAFTIGELQNKLPLINWLSYINNHISSSGVTVTDSEEVNVVNFDYLEKLMPLLKETISSPKGIRTVQNHVAWTLVQRVAELLSSPFREAKQRYINEMSGTTSNDKWELCLNEVTSAMPLAVGSLMVRKTFDSESKKVAFNMLVNIKKFFIDNLSHISWMDDKTRSLAREKAKKMSLLVGYPDFIINNTLIDAYFKDYDIRENEWYENLNRYFNYSTRKEWSVFRSKVDKTSWYDTVTEVNAAYIPQRNQIIIQAALLQPGIFQKDLPSSINYGSIGMVVGHEVLHGFDNHGSKYDFEGTLKNAWNDKIRKKFNNRAQCLVDQYSNYTIQGKNLNGKLNLGENIADNGGLKYAYKAFLSLKQEEGLLPGLSFNHKQLFFIAFAQSWCVNERPLYAKAQVDLNVHSAKRYRVIGSVSNSKEFAKAFNCPVGSPMNPAKKCDLW